MYTQRLWRMGLVGITDLSLSWLFGLKFWWFMSADSRNVFVSKDINNNEC
jgi:hypothetical protein